MSEAPEKLLANALPHGIVVLDSSGHVRWSNEIAKHYLPVSDTAFFNQFDLNSNFDALEIQAPQNKNKRISLSLRPYLEDQRILIIQDVTHQTRLEAMRRDFIANVSHELRTPLTVFRGYLELLIEYPDLAPGKRHKILQQMTEQDQRMEHLVKDLLLLARLESDTPERDKHENVNVPLLIEDIYRGLSSLSAEHQIKLDLEEGLIIMGEPHELRSAFTNIITNAIRYTPKGGVITIGWYADENGKHFSVTDTGVGIAKEHIDRVTQRFYRVDKARSREQGGTGLGLAIVKHVLIRHGGQLSIESEPGKGSTFCCTFNKTREPLNPDK